MRIGEVIEIVTGAPEPLAVPEPAPAAPVTPEPLVPA